MPTTRSKIKAEPIVDNNMSIPPASDTLTSLQASTRATSGMTAVNQTELRVPSSGSTVRNDDVDMFEDVVQDEDANVSENSTSTTNSTLAPSSTFAELPRKLIKAIKKLEALGIDSTLPSLPMIVVVGDQSHGKSSIIEAVCDITLPRSEGTCTRCPFSITTTAFTPTGNWHCQICLILKYEYNPGTSRWESTGTNKVVKFAIVTDKSMLEHHLRLAQIAILNPQISPEDSLRANDVDGGRSHQLSFSPNQIYVEVAAENMPELSLTDLPGAINIAPTDNEQHLPKFIEGLVKTYIKDSKTLILLAVAANCDTETSTAFGYIQQRKARDRCIGVLTKADLVQGSHQQLRRILNQEVHVLGNGWFVTKQLSQADLDKGVTYAEARDREAAFFQKQPWSTALYEFSARFGIPSLQEALSKKLTEHIQNCLPDIHARVEDRLQQVTDQLAAFPEQVRAPCLTVMNEADSITYAINAELHGTTQPPQNDDGESFRYAYRQIIISLREKLCRARPRLILTTPGLKQKAMLITLDSSDEEELPSPPPAVNASKFRKGKNGRAVAVHSPFIKSEHTVIPPAPAPVFHLDQIKQAYDRGWTSGLSNENNPKVTERLVKESLSGWPQMIDSTLKSVQELSHRMLSASIENVLATRRHTKLYTEATQIVQRLYLELMQKQHDLIRHVVACEMHKPITYAHEALKQTTTAEVQRLLNERTIQRVNEYFDADTKHKQPLKEEERKKQANLGPDPYCSQIGDFAKIHAYYDIASRWIVDSVAKHLEYGLMHALELSLKDRLREGLQTTNSEHCAELLAEDPRREELRSRLLAEEAKLMQALDELQGLRHLN